MQYRTIKDVRGADINVSAHPERYMRIIAISVGPIALHIPMDRVDEIISALNGAQHFVWEFDNHPDNVPDRRAGDAVGSEAAIKSAEDEFAQINAAQDASYNPAEINPVAHEQVK